MEQTVLIPIIMKTIMTTNMNTSIQNIQIMNTTMNMTMTTNMNKNIQTMPMMSFKYKIGFTLDLFN